MDGGAWWAAVHGVTKTLTWLSNFTFTFHFHALEKEMATHSSILAWRIPGTGEPGGLLSMGSHRVGHDWSDLAAAAAATISCKASGKLRGLTVQSSRVTSAAAESYSLISLRNATAFILELGAWAELIRNRIPWDPKTNYIGWAEQQSISGWKWCILVQI